MLRRTYDRKVTNLPSKNGKTAKVGNAFSLPAGISCPSKTTYCESICYAGKLEKLFKGFRENVEHNYNVLKDLSYDEMYIALHNMIQDFVTESNRHGAPLFFRIHADGDFFSEEYAMAWAEVISDFSNIKFWVYTRDIAAAVILVFNTGHNCTIYLSGDRDNVDSIQEASHIVGLPIAMVGDTFAEAKELMGNLRSVRCPENNKAIPLIDTAGSACAKCGLCIEGRNNVLFSRSKK